jgi:uncharacterized phage protein (TIGR02218 family)
MKAISSELQAIFDGGNFFMADLFTIECLDGTALRYTSADRRITGTQYRRPITISHSITSAELLNFPVPIVISGADDPVFTHGSSSGYDIYVTAEDGVSVLDFERAVWDKANHLLVLFVRIARLSATKDTTLYLFYGDNVDGVDLSHQERVWDRDFVAVYHFEDDPAGGVVSDSTRRDFHCYPVDWEVPSGRLVSAVAGRGWRFDQTSEVERVYNGGTDKPNYGYDVFGSKCQAFTVEGVLCRTGSSEIETGRYGHAWINILAEDFAFRGLLDVTCTGAGLSDVSALANAVEQAVSTGDGLLGSFTPHTAAYDLAEYHHIAGTGARSTLKISNYVDGTLIGAATGSVDWAKPDSGAYKVEMGDFYGFGGLTGILAEVRISKVERSAAWIAATAASLLENASFVTVGEPTAIDTTFEPFRIDRTKRTWQIGLATDEMEIAIYPELTDTVEGLAWPEAVRRGIFDRARVSVRKAFYEKFSADADACKLAVFKGRAGEIEMSGNKVTMRVESLLSLLDEQMPRNIYQAPCTNMLWDDNCHLDPDAWAVSGAVGSVHTVRYFYLTGDAAAKAAGYFTLGTVEFTSGVNAGISRDITCHEYLSTYGAYAVHILPPLAAAPAEGDTVVLHPGCDKTADVCNSRFSNFTRFRGCPYIPVAESAL